MASEWLFPDTDREENVDKTTQEELFVFGYACKLFRDDDQAELVDAGKYMIPWMGDDKLKIDRYDGRGHLYDLSAYDADKMKGVPPPELTDDEKQIEKLCEEERYLELHTNIAEKSMYEEEEWKRYYESLSEGYKAVGFSYDYSAYVQQYAYTDQAWEETQEQPFVPPEELHVPTGCEIPATAKINSIIEKTAKFIAEHGPQMEIMMKTKQARNAQFDFMHFENALHQYYKHMVKMIKMKKYHPKIESEDTKEDEHNDSGEMAEGYQGYLHPTLLTTNRASPTPEVYKPLPIQMPKVSIHETSYGQLLQSMEKVNKEVAEKNRAKELKAEIKSEPRSDSPTEYGPSGLPPPPGIEPVTLPKSEPDLSEDGIKQEPGETDGGEAGRASSPMTHIVPPPPDAQPVVDRMAMYVAKNGEEFEIVVKSKKDPRFQFLESWHTHYSYYDFKKHLFIQEMERERKEKEVEEKRKEKEKAEKLAKGVKFKLKKMKEQDTTALEKKVFENDETDEDEQDDKGDGVREKKNKSDVSGTSTPVIDPERAAEAMELMEKKLAEQRVKDRLAATAREKLSQADKEKQKREERKKKAAMFLNMLKAKTDGDEEGEVKSESVTSTPADSGTNTPVKAEEKQTKKSSKRSRDRSREKRSRSRSRSKSKSKKKRRKRSPTPPTAYAVVRRSPSKRPPPPPPRYIDMRSSSRVSRSPSGSRSSRQKSRSPVKVKSKSKKKKRSRSPKSKRDDSGHRKSSKKKKKRDRTKSRSPEKKSSRVPSVSPVPEDSVPVVSPKPVEDPRVVSPAGVGGAGVPDSMDELEEGETRDSTPEPSRESEVEEHQTKEPTPPPDVHSDDNRSRSSTPNHDKSPHRSSCRNSMSRSPSKHREMSRSPSKSRDRSRSPSKHRDRSRSPSKHSNSSRSPSKSRDRSRSQSKHSDSSRSPSKSRDRSRSPSEHCDRSRSPSKHRDSSRSSSKGRELSRSPSKHREASPLKSRRSRSRSRSRQRSLSVESSGLVSGRSSTVQGLSSREGTPGLGMNGATSSEAPADSAPTLPPQRAVSSYMLDRVRALIKASKEAVKQEENTLFDDS